MHQQSKYDTVNEHVVGIGKVLMPSSVLVYAASQPSEYYTRSNTLRDILPHKFTHPVLVAGYDVMGIAFSHGDFFSQIIIQRLVAL